MRIALAQLASGTDPTANLEQVVTQVARAAELGADLVVCPEATMCAAARSPREVAEPLDGPWAAGVREAAARHAVVVVAGMYTPRDDDRVANTLLVTGPGVEASYDKIHLYDAFGFVESETAAPGTDPVVVEVAGVAVGLATCYDVRFPELFTRLADQGAQMVALPSSWGTGPGKLDQWRLLIRARALDSTTFVLGCGQAELTTAGNEVSGARFGVGHSLVAAPDGSVVAELGAEPGLLVTDLDPARVAEVRRQLPVLANRRLSAPH